MRVETAGNLAPELRRATARVLAPLGAPAGLTGTLVVGIDDATLPTTAATRPLAVMPATGPLPPPPWGIELVRHADAVLLLDAGEVCALGDALTGRSVIVTGLPAPAPRPRGTGLDTGDAPEQALSALRRRRAPAAAGDAGVAWIGGRGAAPLARALEAWAAGRAVVALPGTPDHELLRAGRALRTASFAEAVEATTFLLRTPALARVLGARGRAVADRLPPPVRVAHRVLEGLELARQVVADRDLA